MGGAPPWLKGKEMASIRSAMDGEENMRLPSLGIDDTHVLFSFVYLFDETHFESLKIGIR